jgi:4-amino-4-deoxychorismate lyase
MFPLLETIKISEQGAENLPCHQRRMNNSYAELFGQENPFRLQNILGNMQANKGQILKCSLIYGARDYQLHIRDYRPAELQCLKLVHADSLDYHLKYADRSELNKLREQRAECEDILIVKKGLITDTSYANIAFLSEGRWITPATPLLKGTQRQFLLDKQIISKENITPDDLKLFECFRIFNAMLPFQRQKGFKMENIRR